MVNHIRIGLLVIAEFTVGVIEFLVGLRFIFKVFGASASSDFVNWIYTNSQSLIHPFTGAFPSLVLTSGLTIEFPSLLALLIYGIIGFFVIQGLSHPISSPTKSSSTKVE